METAYFLVRFQNNHSFTQCLLLFTTNETSANKWRRILKSAKKNGLFELGSEVQWLNYVLSNSAVRNQVQN